MPVAETSKLPDFLQDSRMLNMDQVAEWLGISKWTVMRLMVRKQDPLPSIMFNNSRRFPFDKVRWWADNQSATPSE